jgi:putative ATP-dependent endonuclease of OLD family
VEWFRDGRAVPLWFDPETQEVLPEQTCDRQQLACQIIFAAHFNRETLEVETARYFNDGGNVDVFADDNVISVPGKLIREVGFFLIPASRTWEQTLSFNSELFRRVIRSTEGLPAQAVIDERDRLRHPDNCLEDDSRFEPVIKKVNSEIQNLFGKPIQLRLRLTTTDSAGVLETVMPHFDAGDGFPVPSKRQGSGLISLQSLFLLLHFGQKRVEDGESFFMALEEPELHLPPAVQRRVLSRLQSLSTQTIVTTHSPLIAAYCEALSLTIVGNNAGRLDARPILKKPLGQNATNAVRRLFQINRVETTAAMMHETILVPEGRFDFDWLVLFQRVAELFADSDVGPCIFGIQVGVVPTGDAKVKETCEVLAKAHPNVVALVDGDSEGTRYANELDEPNAGAKKVLRWPKDWEIENFICWIIEADELRVMARLDQEIDPAPGDLATLLTRLRSQDRGRGGLKGDGVVYEIIANALCDSPPCRSRTRRALHAIALACAGTATNLFTLQVRAEGSIPRLEFAP